MKLTESIAGWVGSSAVRAIASATSAFRHFMVYADTLVSSAISGAVGVVKDGSGALTISGANDYSGNTAINAGVLSIASTGALPGWNVNGRYSVEPGATLAVYNAVTDASVAIILGTTNFRANSAIGFDTTSGARTYPNVVANTAQGALGLTKLGANTLTISGANTYTGPTLVIAGTMATSAADRIPNNSDVTIVLGATLSLGGSDQFSTLAGAGTLARGANATTLSSSNSATFTGTMTNSGGTFTKTGTGTQTLGGTTTFAGPVQLTGGTLAISAGTHTQTAAASPRNFQMSISSGQVSVLTISGGTLTTTGFFFGENGGGTSTVNCNGGTIQVNGQTWQAGALSTLNVNGGTFSAGSFDAGGGSGTTTSIVNLLSGAMTLTGTLRWGISGAAATSVFNLDGGVFTSAAWFRSGGAVNTFNFNGGTFTTTTNNLTITQPLISCLIKEGGAVFSPGAGINLIWDTVLANAAGAIGSLVKNGAGTLILTQANTFTGIITINAGTLQMGNSSSTGAVGAASGITNNSTLRFARTNTFTQGVDFPAISGAGILIQAGSGTVVMALSNAYSGETRISSGILQLAHALGFGSGDIKFLGGTMQYGVGLGSDVSARIKGNSLAVRIDTNGESVDFASLNSSNTGGLVKTGAGTLSLSGSGNTFTGTFGSNGGTLSIAGSIANSSRIFVSDAGTTGVMTISGSLTQFNTSGPRSCQVAVNSGNSGTLTIVGGANVSLGSGLMLGDNGGGNGTFNMSGGTLTTNGGLWFAGPTSVVTISGGTVNINTDAIYIGGGGVNNSANNSTFTVSGTAAITCTHRMDFGVGSSNSTMFLNLDGGSISCPNLFYRQGAATINFNGGKLVLTATSSVPSQIATVVKAGGAVIEISVNNTHTLAGALTNGGGSGGLVKQGGGTLVLNGADTYTGATSISAGFLQVSKTVGGIAGTATYTPTALTVNFNNVAPVIGATYKFLPGSTATTGLTISLINAGGRTGAYDYTTSTLTIQ